MKSGGYDREDRFLDASKTGFSLAIRHLKSNRSFAKSLNKATGFTRPVAGRLSRGLSRLTSGFGKFLGAMKNIALSVLPKGAIALVSAGAVMLTSFSSCSYLANKEGDGKTGSYINHGNTVSNEEISYSNANANCRMYYKLLSERKSVWQVYVDESGNSKLIHPTDEHAVSDYFKNDLSFYLQPDLLFSLNRKVFGSDTVYPEAFLNPVAYDPNTYKLSPIVDDDGNLAVTSDVYTKFGQKTGKTERSVSDYGLASVLTYKSQDEVTRFAGTYYKKDVLDDRGVITTEPITENFNFVVKTETKHLLTHAVVFSGDMEYTYDPTTTRTGCVQTGAKSPDETAEVEMYEYFNGEITFGRATRVIKDSAGNTYSSVYMNENAAGFSTSTFVPYKSFLHYDERHGAGYTEEEILAWINSHTKTFDVDGKEITVSYAYTQNYKSKNISLCKYRTSDSGKYVDFVSQGTTTANDYGNKYLYDYLENFSCYVPVNISRSYNSFLNMTSQASDPDSLLTGGLNDYATGAGQNTFEQIYSGSAEGKEQLETIWDILVDWGYTELQAAAFLGNVAQESGYQTSSVNSSTGAYGLCQWLDSRLTNLVNFAGALGKDSSDLYTQVNYACMELSTDDYYEYCDYQWISGDLRDKFKNSQNLEEVVGAIALGWERCGEGEANLSNRISNAASAYEILSGRTVSHHAMDISPTGTQGATLVVTDTSGVTRNMNEVDKEEFNRFYHEVDDIYSGNYTLSYMAKPQGETDINNVLLLANSYIYQTTISKQRYSSTAELWSENYLTDLAEKKRSIADVYGVDYMENPRLSVESVDGMKYWYSENPFYNAGFGLPNCTTWAWGRRYEIEGQKPHLSTGDAHSFWDENTYYKVGQVPRAGAVMVWSKGGGAGHVAIVEQVNADGTITISQSGWKTEAWNPYIVVTKTVEEAEYYAGPPYQFLGYIYLEPAN